MTDADEEGWHKKRNGEKQEFSSEQWRDFVLVGVPDRNAECWLALNRSAIAELCNCEQDEIPREDPSGFIQKRLHTRERNDEGRKGREAIRDFVSSISLRLWLDDPSFRDFYSDVRARANEHGCSIPDEHKRS